MRNYLRRLWSPPIFDDEEKTRVARFLNTFGWIAIVILLATFIARVVFWGEIMGLSLMLILGLICILGAVQFVIRLGYVRSASIFLMIGAWTVLVYQAWRADGLRDVSMIGFLILTMLASLLLGWRGALASGIVSIASIWYFASLEHQGIRSLHMDDPFSYARDLTVLFFLAGALLYLLINSLDRSLHEARLELKERLRAEEKVQIELNERRAVESALRASEERFRKVFHASPVAACITTLEEGRLLEANDAYWKISGYDPTTSIGRTWQELELWDSAEERRKFVDRIKSERSISDTDYNFLTMQGEPRSAIVFYELIEIKEQTCLLSMLYDITAQKQAREELQASEERFRKVFQTSQMAICIASLKQGIFIEANSAFWQLTGLNPEAALGRTAVELGLWPDQDARDRFMHELLEKRSLKNMEIEFPNPGGKNRETLAFYELIHLEDEECILAMFYDVTEQKQAQNALREAEARTRALLDAIPDMIFEISRDGTFRGYIPSSEIKPLFPPEHFVGKTIQELFPSEIAEQTMFALERALETNQLHAFEYGLPAGEQMQFFEARVSAISTELGLVMVRDISRRKWIETEREKLIKELEEKNAELERFTYTVSHDLKSPLITIKGFLGFLERDSVKGHTTRLKADIKRISDATDKMQLLLNELLELSRVGRLMDQYEEIPFEKIAREALELVQGRLLKAHVKVHIQKNMPAVYGDRRRLVEVVQNLVDNGAKFVAGRPKPKIEIGQRMEQDGSPVFFVRDNGIGIPAEHRDRIFGLFNKLDPDSEGTGIGLALVKRILEVHHGRIWVESEAGKGATFFFTLQRGSES